MRVRNTRIDVRNWYVAFQCPSRNFVPLREGWGAVQPNLRRQIAANSLNYRYNDWARSSSFQTAVLTWRKWGLRIATGMQQSQSLLSSLFVFVYFFFLCAELVSGVQEYFEQGAASAAVSGGACAKNPGGWSLRRCSDGTVWHFLSLDKANCKRRGWLVPVVALGLSHWVLRRKTEEEKK